MLKEENQEIKGAEWYWAGVPWLLGVGAHPGGPRASLPRYSDPAVWTAFLGLHDQSKRSARGVQEHQLKRIIVHPSFNDFTFDYDIALLELQQPAAYSSTVRPICLPDALYVFPAGKAIWVTGWGHTQEGGELGPGWEGGWAAQRDSRRAGWAGWARLWPSVCGGSA